MSDILVVGDCHVKPEQDLSRFSLLSKYIQDSLPDYIVIIGDFVTLESLSAWDNDKRQLMEGKRYEADMQAGNEALNLMFAGVKNYNAKARQHKKKMYNPTIIYTEGNHEDRLRRYLEKSPEFHGFVNIQDDLHLSERGIDFYGYGGIASIDDVHFTHIPHGVAGPISGKYTLQRVSDFYQANMVFGHIHRLEYFHRSCYGGGTHNYLAVGCFMDTTPEQYMERNLENYWRGVVNINTDNGFNFQTISMESLYGRYS